MVAPELALGHLRSVVLAAVARRWEQGQKIADEWFQDSGVYWVHREDEMFLGIWGDEGWAAGAENGILGDDRLEVYRVKGIQKLSRYNVK